ncbi:MAG: polysaccharide deacetylase family protein [Cytophagaceae bacterium]
MILILVPSVSNRITYTFNLIFKELLKKEFRVTTSHEEFNEWSGAKFYYGDLPLNGKNSDHLFFCSTGLLFEKHIVEKEPELFDWNGYKVFFKTSSGDLPFDVFSAAFYLVSRYEEYLPHRKDSHGRFRPEQSIAFKGGFLEKPMVNIWASEIRRLIQEKFPEETFTDPLYSFTPTLDIDNAYAYKNKGILRSGFSLASRLMKGQFRRFVKRLKVHVGINEDPYDTFQKQKKIHQAYNLKPNYFFLLGDYGRFDKNISFKNRQLRSLIRSIDDNADIGIHPSYKSNQITEKVAVEKRRLEEILGRKVFKSRQHYIKLIFPDTYTNLINAGIREDYSMGYASKSGFRASICSSFYFYNLLTDQITDLRIYPFAIMDSTLKHYLKLRSRDVVSHVKPIVDEVKKVGGNFIFIFHNESLSNQREWKNWGDMYERIIRLASDRL